MLSPLTFATKAVAPLEAVRSIFDLQANSPVTIEWTPADPDSRVQVVLISGSHDPNPLTATIVCDIPDGEGSVPIPAGLIDEFLGESCESAMMKCSRIARCARDSKTYNGKSMEFFVGSAGNLQHNLWAEYWRLSSLGSAAGRIRASEILQTIIGTLLCPAECKCISWCVGNSGSACMDHRRRSLRTAGTRTRCSRIHICRDYKSA